MLLPVGKRLEKVDMVASSAQVSHLPSQIEWRYISVIIIDKLDGSKPYVWR